jgi:Tfp pilus assembly protein PilF
MKKQKSLCALFTSLVLASAALAVLTACSPGVARRYSPQFLLESGLQQYEEGRYSDAEASLELALKLGLPLREEVSARKHLAFMHCAAQHEDACRSEFQKALAADPEMALDAAEASHPAWGPVFETLRWRALAVR